MTTKLIADIRADIERFRSGADPTLDVENILDLIAENERLRNLVFEHHSSTFWGHAVAGQLCPVCPPDLFARDKARYV